MHIRDEEFELKNTSRIQSYLVASLVSRPQRVVRGQAAMPPQRARRRILGAFRTVRTQRAGYGLGAPSGTVVPPGTLDRFRCLDGAVVAARARGRVGGARRAVRRFRTRLSCGYGVRT